MKHLTIETLIERAEFLIEALPYFVDFRHSLVVIKYGGAAMVNEDLKRAVIEDVALMHTVGIQVVIVHGGGKEITDLQTRMGEETVFVDGQRVTDERAMAAAEMVLAGRLSGEIVAALNLRGVHAVGISGKGGALLRARKQQGPKDLGFVGEIERVDTKILDILTGNGFIPVVSPIGLGSDGRTYNINADTAALEIAIAVNARKLVFLSDIPGVLRDVKDPNSLVSTIRRDEVEALIKEGVVAGGMIPKLRAAARALEVCQKVHILDGRRPHSLLLELFTKSGIGTEIVR